MTERISVDGEPLSEEQFLDGVQRHRAVPRRSSSATRAIDHPVSFFETVVAMAFSTFADAPVDVAVVEVGMGGSWDATNVADATVAVIDPDQRRPRRATSATAPR